MSAVQGTQSQETAEEVLATVAGMIRSILDEDALDEGLDDVEITMETSFADDLMLESIDMVALSERLEERYGDRVNFAEFIADMELEEIISLTVGRLVDHVLAGLGSARGEG
ncbi:acyl carrier protein [Streptomyces sp. DSM 44917]|uniref:Acyl carrier protein n=1 Tax=Streptomyces boetiae TaxID=3075541 RepID=A0ABU2L8Z6_9ACTN|nr:phosphopantetheine-binding protein [Streptomyces sp. DSM 44917]MDT0307965.1 acyl carrier protein [Streptomyces sp. DSM 44917]